MDTTPAVTIDEIREAARRLEGVARRTPVMTSGRADAAARASVFFKCENFQRAGAFKFRGAYNALSQLGPSQREHGVLAWSSGNHAQAIALAGKLLEIPRTIVMPDDAPAVKLEATRAYGASIVLYDRRTTVREELGRQIARDRNLAIIPPYDHPHIIAGQGTTALELIDEVAALDHLLVPCGGGGLLSGCAVAAKALLPGIKVIGVEPANADDATRSFRSGELVTIRDPQTIADGARTPSLGVHTFPLVRAHVDEMVTVSEEAIITAMRFIWEGMKIVVEPTGALAYAALHSGVLKLKDSRVGVVISGGNVDLASLAAHLAERES